MKVGLVDLSTHGGKIKFEFFKAYYFMKVGLVDLKFEFLLLKIQISFSRHVDVYTSPQGRLS